MRHVPALVAAVTATVGSSFSYGQTWQENFDDGQALSAGRFVVNQAVPAGNVSSTTYTPTADFAYHYTDYQYQSYLTGVAVPTFIPLAPGSAAGTGIGLKVQMSSLGATNGAIAAIPTNLNLVGDFRVEGYLWLNYAGDRGDQFGSQGVNGSTEMGTVGINRDGTVGVAGQTPSAANLATGSGTRANGYSFSVANEGATTSDYRIYSNDPNDDGPSSLKRNGAWPGAIRENRYDLTTGELLVSGTPGTPIRDVPDNASNIYYRDLFKNSDGYEIAGAPSKKWTAFTLEQRGRVSAYMLNGKVISILFNEGEYSGAPQFGYADPVAGVPSTLDGQFALFDNLKATQLGDATQNAIGGNDYAELKASGTYNVSAPTSLTGLVIDVPTSAPTQTTTIGGGGSLNFNGAYGAVLASRGTHTVNAAMNFTADTAIMVGSGSAPVADDPTSVLDLKNVSFDAETNLTKNGIGVLKLNRLRAKSLTNTGGKVVITGAGPSSAGRINGYQTDGTSTASESTLDIGRTVLAVDYVLRTSSTSPTATNSPLVALGTLLFEGQAPDANGPTWSGRGITLSNAPEVTGPAAATSAYAVRLVEASLLGYTETPTAYGTSGMMIDGSTVLLGLTFKADFNFDQTVNFLDLVILAQNYNLTGLEWYQGDVSDSDTSVDKVGFEDLVLLAQTYGMTIGPAGTPLLNAELAANFSIDWAAAQAMVPEPTALAALGLGALAFGRRGRRD